MDNSTKDLTRQALDLPLDERVALADALLASLDPSDPAITDAWRDEAEDRLDAYLRGELDAVPIGAALAKHLQR